MAVQVRAPSFNKVGGYIRVEQPYAQFYPLTNWVVVKEHLGQKSSAGLVLLDKDHVTLGTVLKVGDWAHERDGLEVGDLIGYTEWEGGRWAFADPDVDGGERRVLVMESEWILFRMPGKGEPDAGLLREVQGYPRGDEPAGTDDEERP